MSDEKIDSRLEDSNNRVRVPWRCAWLRCQLLLSKRSLPTKVMRFMNAFAVALTDASALGGRSYNYYMA